MFGFPTLFRHEANHSWNAEQQTASPWSKSKLFKAGNVAVKAYR